MSPFDLTGKTILVTGASSGIGRQCAISCSQMGASLLLLGRNGERLEETLLLTNYPEAHSIYLVDLADYDNVKKFVQKMNLKNSLLHGLVHCAGISDTIPFKYVKQEKVEQFFKTNVYSAYNLTKEVYKSGGICKEGGSVIFLSSVMGCVGANAKSLYAMTKGALLSVAKSLACELAKQNIRVNTISPGTIITPINEHLPHIADPQKRKDLEDLHLLGLGIPEDVANACIYLLSDASRWVTGTNLIVDGGYTAR